jgi:hypothetical protein
MAVRVSENTKMTSTFLHEDKNVPPDEAVERDAPRVPVVVSKCGLSECTLNFQTMAPEQSVSTNAAVAARGRLCKRHQNAFHR